MFAPMDTCKYQLEMLKVQTQQREDTMSHSTTLTIPQNQVDMLLQEMADEAGLDVKSNYHGVSRFYRHKCCFNGTG